MGKTDDDKPQPQIILEGTGWKRRSGFGKYSDTIGMGSAWERRRFALTAKPLRLSYYECDDDGGSSKSLFEETPRGMLDVLPERVTVAAAYPAADAALAASSSQPTPFAVNLRTLEGEKWKFCFDDRETQLLWLVALTDIVAEASVQEFNAKVLMAEVDKSTHGGFHRLYEDGEGRLLDLVHTALLSGGLLVGGDNKRSKSEGSTGEAIEVVRKPSLMGRDTSIRIVSTRDESANVNTPRGHSRQGGSNIPTSNATDPFSFSYDYHRGKESPVEKIYQALAVVAMAVLFEHMLNASPLLQSLLWKFVVFVILCICFFPTKKLKEGKGGSKEGADDLNESDTNKQDVMTSFMVGKEPIKAEENLLSDVPPSSEQKLSPKKDIGSSRTLVPFPEDEMAPHERWAVPSPSVDLTGKWTLIADDDFKAEYDAYLKQLGFGGVTRRLACSLIARTTEVTKQSDNGRELYLKGTNPKGAWERTLTSSGFPDFETLPEQKEGKDYIHAKTSIKTADLEDVEAEAWWEECGTKHRSWLRGGKKYGGGDFESIRYIEDDSDGNLLVCESIFHPNDSSKKKAVVTWRFQRDAK